MSEPQKSFLSQGAEVLLRFLQEGTDSNFDCDVLIVGSGYGGAVAAARLAGSTVTSTGKKAKVWLLERGREYAPGQFPARFSELAGHVRFNTQNGSATRGRAEGLFDVRLGGDVSALLGNGLGGGSLINASVMEEPDAQVFDTGWPDAITHEALVEAYTRARTMLQPQTLGADPSPRWKAFKSVARANGTEAKHCAIAVNLGGETVSAAGVPLNTCTHCGDCMTGCNQGAKGSLDTNYLAWAHVRGVDMFCGGVVEHVLPADDGQPWHVTWHFTDPARRLPDVSLPVVRARHVVLAAGSFGSTEILLRSKAQGLPVSERMIGKKFSGNGDFLAAGVRHRKPVHASADQESDPADCHSRGVGPTITGLARGPKADGKLPFVVEEFGVPAALRQVFGELAETIHALRDHDQTTPAGTDPMAVTDASIDRCSLYGMMGDDGADGVLELPTAVPQTTVEGALRAVWNGTTASNLFKDQSDWLKTGLKHLCESDEQPAPHPLRAFGMGAVTVHPLGGCPMGNNMDEGVVDAAGRVFSADSQAHPGLVVLDGSIVPRALGINPALTIAALAERAIPLLLDNWDLKPADATPATRLVRPPGRRRELPPASADWLLRECLHGPMVFGNTTYWARLDIEFEPIPGFGKALALATRVAGARRAILELWSAQSGADLFSWTEKEQTLLCTAELAGSLRLFEVNTVKGQPPQRLTYQLSVQSLSGMLALPIAVGGRFEGVKHFGETPNAKVAANPWRQLTEMTVSYDGGAGTGRWSLDFGDLADQREPLLRLLRLSSMPDALGDAGTLGLYVLRQTLPTLQKLLGQPPGSITPHHLNERYPHGLLECAAQRVDLPAGARLTRFATTKKSALPPVLLIHGLGMSGSSFAHACIPNNLVRHLCNTDDRDVWVLDLRSSVANEAHRHDPQTAEWTVDSVANADIPAAICTVLSMCPDDQQVDVVAHCMGAVMFCFAALSNSGMEGKVRAAVLSQVGPLARLSPLNRLRAYVATYLQQYLGIEEFDTSPEWQSHQDSEQGTVWRATTARIEIRRFRDLLPNTFPYPDDDQELQRFKQRGPGTPDFRSVRHRADAIFGQLFELKNLDDDTLTHLDALFGWVKVKMLAQSIHFARQNMLTDANGRNSRMSQANFAQGFSFPVLMLHGRKNRVFDWRGSLASLELLKRSRGEKEMTSPEVSGKASIYGAGTPTQLAVMDGYGHLDCLIGKDAHNEIFPLLSHFFSHAAGYRVTSDRHPKPTCEAPWIGPMLGWVRDEPTSQGALLRVNLLVHPSPRRATTSAVALVPLATTIHGPQPNFKRVRILRLPRQAESQANLPCRVPVDLRQGAIELVLNADLLGDRFDTFALATLHDDVSLPSALATAEGSHLESMTTFESTQLFNNDLAAPDIASMFAQREWLMGSEKPNRAQLAALTKFFGDSIDGPTRLLSCQFSLAKKVRNAADIGAVSYPAQTARDVTFAVASCQYPPGLMDEVAAGASYARLQVEAEAEDGPQFTLLVGDQIYVDATAGVFEPTVIPGAHSSDAQAAFDRAYELNWRLPPFRRTVARIPVLCMLDDHEVSNDWQPIPSAQSDLERTALAAFAQYQQPLNPSQKLSAHSPRSFTAFPAGVGFWVLDTRTQRDLRQVGTGRFTPLDQAHIVPIAVLQDLCDALETAPKDQVKFIVSPSPILPPERFDASAPEERLRSDTWAGYPASSAKLLNFIRDKNIRRVVFLAGDAHLSSVCSFAFVPVTPHDDNRVVSIVSSGMYTPWPFANQRPDELVLQGSVDLGSRAAPCRGALTLHALSQQAGYAVVSVVATDGMHTALRVCLRPAQGTSMATEIRLH